MFRHVPNLLTALRLVLAAVFFAMLGYYQHDVSGRHGDVLWLNIAFAVYLIALATDFLDGYLARKWHVEGAFGRVVDPFVDKVLVLGSFIFFAGKNFTIPFEGSGEFPTNVRTITGVVPWMVVVILARELLVTSLRGLFEGGGQNFGAAFSGKLKMVLQSVTILVVLVYVNYFAKDWPGAWLRLYPYERYARVLLNLFIWTTVVVTIISGLMYVQKAVAMYRTAATAK
jgi:CDP-diacylglycerol--glycerol-3-phosphate 3-phosphatidyltransferase